MASRTTKAQLQVLAVAQLNARITKAQLQVLAVSQLTARVTKAQLQTLVVEDSAPIQPMIFICT